MSDKRIAARPSECENVAKKSLGSITLEKKMEVIRRMEDGQARRNVCRCVKLTCLLIVSQ
jgi:hypothetical protein